eukprot:5623185-Ditylum_brightwellii.AAC.1
MGSKYCQNQFCSGLPTVNVVINILDTANTASTVSYLQPVVQLLIGEACIAAAYAGCIFCAASIREEILHVIMIFHILHAYSIAR